MARGRLKLFEYVRERFAKRLLTRLGVEAASDASSTCGKSAFCGLRASEFFDDATGQRFRIWVDNQVPVHFTGDRTRSGSSRDQRWEASTHRFEGTHGESIHPGGLNEQRRRSEGISETLYVPSKFYPLNATVALWMAPSDDV